MVERILILPDVHLTQEGYTQVYATVKRFLRYFKPHETILLGDFMDCLSLSAYDTHHKKTFEGKRFHLECEVASNELDYISEHSRRVTWLEGNHEYRVEKKILENPQENEGDLEIPIRLSLMKRNIKWVKMNQLYPVGNCYFTHGMWINGNHAKKHVTSLGCCICYGHTHNAQTYQLNMKMQEPFMAYGLGCLCNHEPFWLKGRHANWINQFATMYYNTKSGNFNLQPVNVIEGGFIYNNKQF